MPENERFMELKDKLFKADTNRRIIKNYLAMIATFAVKNDITLADAQEIAAEIVGEYGQSLLDKGQFAEIRAEYKKQQEGLKTLGGEQVYQ